MMTNNEQHITLQLLEDYATLLKKSKTEVLNPIFKKFLSKKDIIEILESSWFQEDLAKHDIYTQDKEQLFELIGEDSFILEFYIQKITEKLNQKPSLSQSSVDEFFLSRNLELHYLASKPVSTWDEYDTSNYYSLLLQKGVTKRVFAIFTADVKDGEQYAVTTQPTFFFDTKEEAEAELKKVLEDKKFKRDELKIMSLWQIK